MNKITPGLLLALVMLGTGCSKASKEDCGKAFEKMIELQLGGKSPEAVKLVRPLLDRTKEPFMKECEGKVPKSAIDCLLNAKTKAEFDKCR